MDIADRVRKIQTRHRADFADEGFNNELKFGLVEVVYEWAKGMVRSFSPLPLPLLVRGVLTRISAIRANHDSHRCTRGNNRSRNYSIRRNLSRSKGRSSYCR